MVNRSRFGLSGYSATHDHRKLKVNVLLAGFVPAITLLPGNSESSRKPPYLLTTMVMGNTKGETDNRQQVQREILPSDVDGLFQLDSDPEVHMYLGNKPVENKEQIIAVINFIRQQYVDNGIGRWAIIEKETSKFIGWTGLKFIRELTNGHINYYDLGYRLIQKYWGQGYASESAKASLDYGFDKLNLSEIYAMADCDNMKSNNVLKKIGLRFMETFYLDVKRHNWYKIERTNNPF
jgi:ribosomal-protein-alanine N-acetyltransferase